MKKTFALIALVFPLLAMAQEISLSATGHSPVLTKDARGLLVAWVGTGGIHTGGVRADGVRRAESVIETTLPPQELVLQSSADQALVAWFEDGSVYAQRLDANDAPVGARIDLGLGVTPAIAATPDGFRVAWSDGAEQRIVSTRIAFDGTVGARQWLEAIDDITVPVQEEANLDGAVPLLAWNDLRSGNGWQLVVSPIDGNGQRVGNGSIVAHDPVETALACGPQTCLVAWFELDPSAAEPDGADLPRAVLLHTALVSHDGLLLRESRDIAQFYTGGWSHLPIFVGADESGAFTVAVNKLKVDIAANGEVGNVLPWTGQVVSLGGVTRLNGATYVAYSSVSGIYVRKLGLTKLRAVR